MKIDSQTLIKLITLIEVEDHLTAELKEMGTDVDQLTLSEITTKLRTENPELVEKIRDVIRIIKNR